MNLIARIFSLKRFSFLLFQLVRRDFKLKYRGSFLGILWSILNPLLNMIVLSVVFGQVFKAVDNFKMYLLSGLLMFNFFSEASNIATNSIVGNFNLITKIYFPKFIIPLSKVLSTSINLLMTTVVFLILGLFMDVFPWWGYIFIPYVLICLLIFVIGMSFIVSALQVFFRDTAHLYNVILTIWMYATPIMYPIDIIPSGVWKFLQYNPMYVFIDFLRKLTMYATIPSVMDFLLCGIYAVAFFVIGAVVFVKLQKDFIFYS